MNPVPLISLPPAAAEPTKTHPTVKHFALLAFVLPALAGSAQQAKYGYVNSVELLNIMPESRVADSLLRVMQKEFQTIYDSYLKEYGDKSSAYLRQKDSLSATVAEIRLKDLQDLEKKIKDFETSSQAQLQTKRDELFEPILVRATQLVQEVAEDHGFRMIFDSSSGAIAYAPEGDNVIGLLRKKLGLPGKPPTPQQK